MEQAIEQDEHIEISLTDRPDIILHKLHRKFSIFHKKDILEELDSFDYQVDIETIQSFHPSQPYQIDIRVRDGSLIRTNIYEIMLLSYNIYSNPDNKQTNQIDTSLIYITPDVINYINYDNKQFYRNISAHMIKCCNSIMGQLGFGKLLKKKELMDIITHAYTKVRNLLFTYLPFAHIALINTHYNRKINDQLVQISVKSYIHTKYSSVKYIFYRYSDEEFYSMYRMSRDTECLHKNCYVVLYGTDQQEKNTDVLNANKYAYTFSQIRDVYGINDKYVENTDIRTHITMFKDREEEEEEEEEEEVEEIKSEEQQEHIVVIQKGSLETRLNMSILNIINKTIDNFTNIHCENVDYKIEMINVKKIQYELKEYFKNTNVSIEPKRLVDLLVTKFYDMSDEQYEGGLLASYIPTNIIQNDAPSKVIEMKADWLVPILSNTRIKYDRDRQRSKLFHTIGNTQSNVKSYTIEPQIYDDSKTNSPYWTKTLFMADGYSRKKTYDYSMFPRSTFLHDMTMISDNQTSGIRHTIDYTDCKRTLLYDVRRTRDAVNFSEMHKVLRKNTDTINNITIARSRIYSNENVRMITNTIKHGKDYGQISNCKNKERDGMRINLLGFIKYPTVLNPSQMIQNVLYSQYVAQRNIYNVEYSSTLEEEQITSKVDEYKIVMFDDFYGENLNEELITQKYNRVINNLIPNIKTIKYIHAEHLTQMKSMQFLESILNMYGLSTLNVNDVDLVEYVELMNKNIDTESEMPKFDVINNIKESINYVRQSDTVPLGDTLTIIEEQPTIIEESDILDLTETESTIDDEKQEGNINEIVNATLKDKCGKLPNSKIIKSYMDIKKRYLTKNRQLNDYFSMKTKWDNGELYDSVLVYKSYEHYLSNDNSTINYFNNLNQIYKKIVDNKNDIFKDEDNNNNKHFVYSEERTMIKLPYIKDGIIHQIINNCIAKLKLDDSKIDEKSESVIAEEREKQTHRELLEVIDDLLSNNSNKYTYNKELMCYYNMLISMLYSTYDVLELNKNRNKLKKCEYAIKENYKRTVNKIRRKMRTISKDVIKVSTSSFFDKLEDNIRNTHPITKVDEVFVNTVKKLTKLIRGYYVYESTGEQLCQHAIFQRTNDKEELERHKIVDLSGNILCSICGNQLDVVAEEDMQFDTHGNIIKHTELAEFAFGSQITEHGNYHYIQFNDKYASYRYPVMNAIMFMNYVLISGDIRYRILYKLSETILDKFVEAITNRNLLSLDSFINIYMNDNKQLSTVIYNVLLQTILIRLISIELYIYQRLINETPKDHMIDLEQLVLSSYDRSNIGQTTLKFIWWINEMISIAVVHDLFNDTKGIILNADFIGKPIRKYITLNTMVTNYYKDIYETKKDQIISFIETSKSVLAQQYVLTGAMSIVRFQPNTLFEKRILLKLKEIKGTDITVFDKIRTIFYAHRIIVTKLHQITKEINENNVSNSKKYNNYESIYLCGLVKSLYSDAFQQNIEQVMSMYKHTIQFNFADLLLQYHNYIKRYINSDQIINVHQNISSYIRGNAIITESSNRNITDINTQNDGIRKYKYNDGFTRMYENALKHIIDHTNDKESLLVQFVNKLNVTNIGTISSAKESVRFFEQTIRSTFINDDIYVTKQQDYDKENDPIYDDFDEYVLFDELGQAKFIKNEFNILNSQFEYNMNYVRFYYEQLMAIIRMIFTLKNTHNTYGTNDVDISLKDYIDDITLQLKREPAFMTQLNDTMFDKYDELLRDEYIRDLHNRMDVINEYISRKYIQYSDKFLSLLVQDCGYVISYYKLEILKLLGIMIDISPFVVVYMIINFNNHVELFNTTSKDHENMLFRRNISYILENSDLRKITSRERKEKQEMKNAGLKVATMEDIIDRIEDDEFRQSGEQIGLESQLAINIDEYNLLDDTADDYDDYDDMIDSLNP